MEASLHHGSFAHVKACDSVRPQCSVMCGHGRLVGCSHDFAIRLIEYGTSCCGHVTVTLFDMMSYIGI